MVSPLLSVIIPTRNEGGTLPALLSDLRRQEGLPLEIIVADGGSIDATRTVVEAGGATFIAARPGRGAQMNAGAQMASGDYLLFLHADSRLEIPDLLYRALQALTAAAGEEGRCAGHFPLRFQRTTAQNRLAYRYLEEKSACNRPQTINGDQGLLLSRNFFQELGGFDTTLPFLEDQRIAGKIFAQGRWITLPGLLQTSARRFESEGFLRRYILMGMMMGWYSIGEMDFFVRAPGVYRLQEESGALCLSPFFALNRRMLREWGFIDSLRVFYRLGRYIRQNSWQIFFFFDVCLRPRLEAGRYFFLNFHDRIVAPCIDFRIFDAVTGVACFLWYITILPSFFWLRERLSR